MTAFEPTDAATVRPEIRHRAFMTALEALERVLTAADCRLDLFGRLELLDLCLDDAEKRFGGPIAAHEVDA